MLLDVLREKLSSIDRFTDADGRLLRSAVIDATMNMDSSIIKVLMEEPELKAQFFTEVNGVLVFDKTKFTWVVDSKAFLPDSYTAYKNKIGLVNNRGELISQSDDVSLVWPYKDCILEGGQTKEDAKHNEVFYNENLVPLQVSKLLSPKVLSNAMRYDSTGSAETTNFAEDDNLIIKGNNLVALTTLQRRFGRAIRLIYIDPPYNTGDDSFTYNDRFSRSTWLTFMKNRVTEAKKLLTDDGVIAIQISFHEGAYLQVMLDGIDGLHHVMSMHVLVRHPDRSLTSDKKFNDVMEMVLIYSRNQDFKMPKRVTDKTNSAYTSEIIVKGAGREETIGGKTVTVYEPQDWDEVKVTPSEDALKSYSIRGSLREKNSSGRFYVAHIEPNAKNYEPLTLFKVPDMGDDGLGYRWFHTPKSGNKNGTYFQGMPQSSATTSTPYANFQDFVQVYNRVGDEGGVAFRNGKKPEGLLAFLLSIFTAPGDRVLDYHFGSGTTGAVAHKMGRQWIGVEQMDYVQNISVERLKKVIAGEKGGVSKETGWSGGGSFVYCELAERNEEVVSEVQSAAGSDTLLTILDGLVERGDLRPEVLPASLTDHQEDFLALDPADQKRAIMEMINKNRLYVAYADRDDETYDVSDEDKAFSASFYGERDA